MAMGANNALGIEPLPIVDAERVRQGQGQAAEVWREGDR
jgi:hypothetical protein